MIAIGTLLRRGLARLMVSFRTGPARETRGAASSSHRIALVKLDGIGDFVLATTFLQIAHAQWPQADITLFCRQPVGQLARQQFPGWSVVELPARTRPLRDIYWQGPARRTLKHQQPFDLLIDLRAYRDMADSAVASWIPAQMKIALKNAYHDDLSWVPLPGEARIYDLLIPLPGQVDPNATRDIQNHRQLAEFFFPNVPESHGALPSLRVTTADCAAVTNLLRDNFSFDATKPFLLVCPGAGASMREYPSTLLAVALKRVFEQSDVSCIVAGGSADRRTTAPLLETLLPNRRILDLTGVLSLAQHVALVSLSETVLCMETSHAHVAGALGKKAVVIIGGGHYGLFAPWGEAPRFRWLTHRLPCFGCHWQCIHSHPLCIQELPPETIAQSLIELLQAS